MLKVLAATENKETKTSMLTIIVDIPYVLLPELLQRKELSVTYKKLEDIPLHDILKNPFTPALLRQSNVGKLALKAENFQEAKNLWLRNLKDKDVFEVWLSEDGTIESQYNSDAEQKEDSGRGDGRFSDFCEIPTLKSNYHELSKLLNCEKSAKLLLTPFAYTTCIISSTNWNEFFEDFCPKYHTPVSGTGFYAKSKKEVISWHSDEDNVKKLEDENFDWSAINWSKARLEWQVIAERIYDLREETVWKDNKYHIPFEKEIDRLINESNNYRLLTDETSSWEKHEKPIWVECESGETVDINEVKMKISTSMCGLFDQYNLSITLDAHFSRLGKMWKSKDYAAFEHQAIAMTSSEYKNFSTTQQAKYEQGKPIKKENFGICDNLNGFISQKYILQHL